MNTLGLEKNISNVAGPYLDFVIDGVSFKNQFPKNVVDLRITAFSRIERGNPIAWRHQQINVLLGKEESVETPGRIQIYVCPGCGDIHCGAITAILTKTSDSYSWSNFRYEHYLNNADGTLMSGEEEFKIEPLIFTKDNYESVLHSGTAAYAE